MYRSKSTVEAAETEIKEIFGYEKHTSRRIGMAMAVRLLMFCFFFVRSLCGSPTSSFPSSFVSFKIPLAIQAT